MMSLGLQVLGQDLVYFPSLIATTIPRPWVLVCITCMSFSYSSRENNIKLSTSNLLFSSSEARKGVTPFVERVWKKQSDTIDCICNDFSLPSLLQQQSKHAYQLLPSLLRRSCWRSINNNVKQSWNYAGDSQSWSNERQRAKLHKQSSRFSDSTSSAWTYSYFTKRRRNVYHEC